MLILVDKPSLTLLYHEHRPLYTWNALVLICATFMAFYIPLCLVLPETSSLWSTILFWFSNLVFLADVFVRYFRWRRELKQEHSSHVSALATIGLVDVVAAVPIGSFVGIGWLQMLRLTKLFRIAQFLQVLRQVEVRLSIWLTLASFFFWAAILIHMLACGWMRVYGINPDLDNTTNYISGLYWTVTTLTTVGYGDILPVTNLQRIYAMMVQVTGLGLFGYLVGNVVSIFAKLDASSLRYKELVELLTVATKRRGLSKDLQRRVLDYYRYIRDEKSGYDESNFLQTLPRPLRTDVALYLKKEFIEGIPLFKSAGEKFVAEIALKLKLMVSTPGDYIFRQGAPADNMYFVISGHLEVISEKENRVLATLDTGDFFGEISMFRNTPRSASVRATSFCNLYRLNRKTFESVIQRYPDVAAQLEEEARHRQAENDSFA